MQSVGYLMSHFFIERNFSHRLSALLLILFRLFIRIFPTQFRIRL